MGIYDNIVKVNEIKKKLDEEDYYHAQKILDTMDLKKVKNPVDLSILAEVYTHNGRYEEAQELLHRIYEKTKSRKPLYQLVWISIKKGSVDEAEKYFTIYEKIAPKDFDRYIFRYKIDKLKGESFEKLIETLEELKETEYIEQWAYELAKLYYKAGMEKECIQECSDIELWFGDGVYVEKAKLLKTVFSGNVNKDLFLEELKRKAADHRTA